MENRVRIVTDSTSDIPRECAEELGIGVVPLHVIKNGAEDFLDGVTLSSDEFFDMLPYCAKVTTSQPSTEEILEVWNRVAPNGEPIVSIHISSLLSKTYERAKEAAELRPNSKVVDSLSVTMGLGFLAKDASELAGDGKSADYIAQHIEALKLKVRMFGVFETLEYLQKGGRIGRAKELLGSMLKIKPMVGLKNGEVVPVTRFRGSKQKAISGMVDIFSDPEHGGGAMARVAVLHAQAEEDAIFAQNILKERFPGLVVPIMKVGPVLGVHSGPGFVAVAGLLI